MTHLSVLFNEAVYLTLGLVVDPLKLYVVVLPMVLVLYDGVRAQRLLASLAIKQNL